VSVNVVEIVSAPPMRTVPLVVPKPVPRIVTCRLEAFVVGADSLTRLTAVTATAKSAAAQNATILL